MPNATLKPDANAFNLIAGWARRAGQIALRHFNAVTPQRKADRSFITQADLEIERFLTERFRAVFPTYGLLSEEGTRIEHRAPPPGLWAIDPLDGTTTFVHGLPGWGISIGLLVEGRPAFGLFYMPLLDDMTWAGTLGEWANSPPPCPLRLRSNWGQKGFLAVSSGAHRNFRINLPRVRALGSVSANLVYTARGSAVAAFIPKARLWDLVAGAAIVAGAGGELRYLSGAMINYPDLLDGQPAPEPIIAGHPRVLDDIQQVIQWR